MHFLTCIHCHRVRQFSGNPLKCEHCGRENATDTEYWQNLRKQRQEPTPEPIPRPGAKPFRAFLNAFVAIVGLGILFVAAIAIVGSVIGKALESDAERLAVEYGISEKNVSIDSKPHGCDFSDAPLGEKHCHFEKDVDIVRECERPNCKVRSVSVLWRKVSE